MCVLIRLAPPDVPPTFDADRGVIKIPQGTAPAHTVTLVRAILSELAVVQPELGAVCWCGAKVDPTPRIPNQRRSEQVVTHGA